MAPRPQDVVVSARVLDLGDGETRARRTSTSWASATATRRSAPRDVVLRAEFAGHADDPRCDADESTRSCAGGASTSPAGRTRARCSPTRPTTPRAGSSRPAGSRDCGWGRGGVGEARQLLRGRAPRPRRRRATRSIRIGPGPRRGRDRRAARARSCNSSASPTRPRRPEDDDDPDAHPSPRTPARSTRASANAASRCSAKRAGAAARSPRRVDRVLSAIGIAFLVVTSPVLDVDHIPVAGVQHITRRAACAPRAAVRRARSPVVRRHRRGRASRRAGSLGGARHSATRLPGHVEDRGDRVHARGRSCASRPAEWCSSPRTVMSSRARTPRRRDGRSPRRAAVARRSGELLVAARRRRRRAAVTGRARAAGRRDRRERERGRARCSRAAVRSGSATPSDLDAKAASAQAVLAHSAPRASPISTCRHRIDPLSHAC